MNSELSIAHQLWRSTVARQIQRMIGGEPRTIRPKEGAGDFLGGYRGANPGWSEHTVILKEGRVYDAFTGYPGTPAEEFKDLWEYPEAIDFGF